MVSKEVIEKEEQLYKGVLGSLIKFVDPIVRVVLGIFILIAILLIAKIFHAIFYVLLIPYLYILFNHVSNIIGKGGTKTNGIQKEKNK